MGRYDNLGFNNGEYVPQYAGLPLDEIQKSADTLAGRHYQNLASLNQLQLLREQYKSKMLPGAAPDIDAQFQDIDLALQDIARNGGENATARVGALTNRFLGDQGVLKGLQRAEEVQKEIELENTLIAKGETPLRKKGLREALMSAKLYDEEGKVNSTYNTPYLSTVTPYQDPTHDYKRIVDEIKPDQWISQGLRSENVVMFNNAKMRLENGEIDIPKFLSEATTAGVTPDKIFELKDKLFTAYKNTKSYAQQKEYLDKTDAEMEQDLYNYAQIGTFSKIDKRYHPVTGGGGGGGKDKVDLSGQEALGAYKMGEVKFPSLSSAPKEPVKPVTSPVQYGGFGAKQAVQNQNTGKVYTNAQDESWRKATEQYQADMTEYNKQKAEYMGYVNTAAEIFGKPVPNPDSKEAKQLMEDFEKYTNERMENQSIRKVGDPQDYKLIQDDIIKNFPYRKIYNINEKEGNTFKDNDGAVRKEFEALLKAKPEELILSGETDPLGPLAREAGPEFVNSYVIQYRDKESGELHEFAVSKSDGELQTRQSNRNEFKNQLYGAVSAKPGQEVEVPISIYNGKGRQPLVNLKAKEHILGQREKLISDIPENWSINLEGKSVKVKDLAKQYEKIFTVNVPGEDTPRIYFTIDQVVNDFLPEEKQ